MHPAGWYDHKETEEVASKSSGDPAAPEVARACCAAPRAGVFVVAPAKRPAMAGKGMPSSQPPSPATNAPPATRMKA